MRSSPDPGDAPLNWGNRPLYAMAAVAVGLAAFVWLSWLAHPTLIGIFVVPPVYGYWTPTISALAWFALPAALLLAALAVWATAGARRTPAVLAAIIAVGLAAAFAVGLVRGRVADLYEGISTAKGSVYNTADLRLANRLGVRGLFRDYAHLAFVSYHNKTHPPGTLAMLKVAFETLGRSHPLRIATALAAVSMCAALTAWWLGRTFGGERAGRIAAVLFVAAPGPLMFAYTSMDTIYATFLAGTVAVFCAAIVKRSAWLAAAGGALLAVTTTLTYATAFVALAAVVAVLAAVRDRGGLRTAAALIGAAGASGLATLVVLRFALDFNLLDLYGRLPRVRNHPQPYWAIASPAVLWIYAGVVLATLGTVGVFMVAGPRLRLILPVTLMLLMFVWATLPASVTHLRYGEVERTWAFLYPVLAAGAGYAIDRWLPRDSRRSRWVIASLVVVSVAQAVLVQSLWNNLF